MAQEEAERYARSFNIPLCWLKQRLSDADIIEIARDLIDWEVNMAVPLELSLTDIDDIKHKEQLPELQRRRVLQLWNSKRRLDATYGLLLVKCLEGGDTKTAENICRRLRLLAQGQGQNQRLPSDSISPPLSPTWQQVDQYRQGIPPQQTSGGQPQDNYPLGYPQWPHSQQGGLPQDFGQQGAPPQGFNQERGPPQGFNQQGGPPQGFNQQGGPPQGFNQQGGPHQGFNQQGGLQGFNYQRGFQGFGQQGVPPQGFSQQGGGFNQQGGLQGLGQQGSPTQGGFDRQGDHVNADVPFRGSSSSPETDGPAGSSDTSTINKVVEYVKDVKHVRAFGLFLKIDPGKLDEIESSPRDTMTQMIEEWFKKYPMSDEERWEELRRILLEPAIREPKMASSLKPHLRRGSSVDSAISVFSCTSRPSITSSSSQNDQMAYIDNIGKDKECSIPNVLNCIEPYHWYDIGWFLDLPNGKLEDIRSYHPANHKAHMVELWYRHPNFCWDRLRQALKQLVCQRRGSGASVNSPPLSPNNAVFTLPEVPIPISYQTESMQVESTVIADIVEENEATIESNFAELVLKVASKLDEKDINMKKFRLYIVTLFRRCNRQSIIAGNHSVTDIFEAISRYSFWNFSSCTRIEKIAKQFGGDDLELKGWIDEYKSELAGFKATTKIVKYIERCNDKEIVHSHQSLQNDMARYNNDYCHKLTVKLKSHVTEKSLDYIDQFWMSFADHFLLPSLSALLDSIQKGCVEVTWLVPTLSALQIQANIQDSTQFLEKLEVIRVIMEGEILYETEFLYENLTLACKEGIVCNIDKMLKRWNPDINEPDEESKTPLILAAENGHECVVSSLLEAEADVNYQTEDKGWSALFYAYANGHVDGVAKLLLEYGADITLKDKSGKVAAEVNTAEKKTSWVKMGAKQAAKLMKHLAIHILRKPNLLSLCHRDDYEGVRRLLEQHKDTDVNITDVYLKNWTPLMHACENGNFEIVKLLLEHKADIDMAARNEWSALPLACSNNFVRIAYLLMKNGADPNRVIDNKTKFTPLLYISDMEHMEPLARALLKHGADLEMATGKSNWTPLIYACHHGRKELVKLYLDKGANFDHTAAKGWTAMMSAARFNREEIISLLIDKGASMELAITDDGNDVAGESSLHIASFTGSPSAVKSLIENGADPNVINKAGLSPLMVATSRNKLEVVEALCESETIDVNLQQKDTHLTALFIAAKNGYVDIFGKLLRCGAHEEVNSISVRDAANFLNKRNIVMELDRYKAEIHTRTEAQIEVRSQEEVPQVEPQAKTPAEEPPTPVQETPSVQVTPSVVKVTSSVQVEERTKESHSIMAAPADVITPALEGSSLEVLDPQLPEETEHETNMPVPIEEERDDQAQKEPDTSSLFDAEDVLPQQQEIHAQEQEDTTTQKEKEDLAKAEKDKKMKEIMDLLATVLSNYHKNFNSSLQNNDSGVSDDTGKGVRPVGDIYHQPGIQQY